MNCGDRYQELLLYLEQTENEIARAFEEVNQNNQFKKVKEKEKTKDSTTNEETDIDFLIELNETIKSDVTELLARNHAGSLFHSQFDQSKVNGSNGQDHYVDHFFNDKKILIQHSPLDNNNIFNESVDSYPFRHSIIDSELSAIDAATQTSPSLSPSSTNLTWASDCSSSPCLTSTSDSELLDEDAHSTSSRDTRDLLFSNGIFKHRRQQVLGSKSSSTPVLKTGHCKVNKQCRSQSDRHLAEIEAAEACKWLRATGFPQYAQLYEDNQFPIDVTTAAQDHPLLEPDVLHSLFRRLQILNSCAHLHQQRVAHAQTDESEDECCALSDNWTYQSDIRRWSRTCNKTPFRTTGETSSRQDSLSNKEDEVFHKSTEDPKDRLRRAGSTKFRRRRDGVLFSEKDNILDTLSQQLNQLKSSEVNHVSDSEVTPRHSRRSRTKSFDKTDTWSHPQATTDRVIWHKLPETKELLSPEKDISFNNDGPSISQLSATQLQVLKKLALLKLTSHMEKYCPSHRTGWNWDLPKLIRKIKAPIYKDKKSFWRPTHNKFPKNRTSSSQANRRIYAVATGQCSRPSRHFQETWSKIQDTAFAQQS
nr:rho GTPase-activating protein 7-like [Leptinotarsa decemlineata]XP_023011892.1 rho GTPase-activating protein 7-like [Leptinotarsa decemlineata]